MTSTPLPPNNTKLQTKGQLNARKVVKKLLGDRPGDLTTRGYALRLVGKSFWLAIYLSAIVAVAFTCYDLYEEYQENPTSVLMSPVHNSSISLPDMTICLPFFHPELLFVYSQLTKNQKYDGIPTKWSGDITQFLFDELAKFLANYTSWQEAREDEWPATVIYVAQVYLSIVYNTENLQGRTNNKLNDMIYQSHLDNVSQVIVEVLIPQMEEWKVTLGEFQNTFARKFRELCIMEEFLVTASEIRPLENISQEIVFVTRHRVCYKLKLENITFLVTTSIKIEIDNRRLQYEGKGHTRTAGHEPITIGVSGNAKPGSITQEFDSMFNADIGYYTTLAVNRATQYSLQSSVKGVPVCSLEESEEICRARCRNEVILKLCNCTAITAPSHQSLAEVTCLIGQYERCLLNFSGVEDAHCTDYCLKSCIYWKYDVLEVPLDDMSYVVNKLWATIEITVTTYDYMFFHEFSEWTKEYIVGSIGGALGFWLGLDIIVIVHAILSVSILFILGRWRFKKNAKIVAISNSLNGTEKNEWKIANYSLIKMVIKQLNAKNIIIKDPSFINWAVRKGIWSVLFFIGAVLTIDQFVHLWTDFNTGNMKSALAVMFNTTMTLPPVALCLVQDEQTDKFDPYSGFDTNSYSIFSSNISIADDYIQRTALTKEHLLGRENDQTWPEEFTFMVYVYLNVQFRILQETYDAARPVNDYQISTFIHDLTLKLLITDDELKEKFAFEVMKWRSITVSCSNVEEDTILNLTSTASVEVASSSVREATSICLHFPTDTFEIKGVDDSCLLRVRQQVRPPWYFFSIAYIAINYPTSSRYLADFYFSPRERHNITFTYSAFYQNDPNRTRCITETSPIVCITNCRNSMVEKNCGNCLATPNEEIERNSSLCTWQEYSLCLDSAASEINQRCNEICLLTPCKRFAMTTDSVFSNSLYDYYYAFGELNLRIENFIYVLISEELIITSADFLSTSGGLLGFWLGLDVTFLISIVFTPIMMIVNRILLRLKSSQFDNDVGEQQVNGNDSWVYILYRYTAKIARVAPANNISRPFIIKTLFEWIFRSIIYLLFTIATLLMCYDCFYDQLLNRPIDSNFKMNSNQAFTFPSTTLCVPLSGSELDEPSSYYYYLPASSEFDFQYIRDLPFNKSEILDKDTPWSLSFLRIARQYLIILDGYKVMEQFDFSASWKRISQQSTQTVDIFGNKLEQQHIATSELRQKFAHELLQFYSINITKQFRNENKQFINILVVTDQITFISEDKVCFKLPADDISFSSPLDRITFQTDKSRLPNVYCSEACTNCPITIDLLGSVSGNVYKNFFQEVSFGSKLTTDISVEDLIEMLPDVDGRPSCSNKVSPTQCSDECRRSAIEQHCNCQLNEAPNEAIYENSANRSECSWTILKACSALFSTTNATDCMNHCLLSCERIRFLYNSITEYGPNNCEAELTLQMTSYQYLIYKENYDWSFWNFVATLGGILGLWLGLDVMFFMDWYFTAANCIFKACTAKSNQNMEEKKPTENRRRFRSSSRAVQPVMELQSM